MKPYVTPESRQKFYKIDNSNLYVTVDMNRDWRLVWAGEVLRLQKQAGTLRLYLQPEE
jgi:hypothetical protein